MSILPHIRDVTVSHLLFLRYCDWQLVEHELIWLANDGMRQMKTQEDVHEASDDEWEL